MMTEKARKLAKKAETVSDLREAFLNFLAVFDGHERYVTVRLDGSDSNMGDEGTGRTDVPS